MFQPVPILQQRGSNVTIESINRQQLKLLIIDDDKQITNLIGHLVRDLDVSVLITNDSELIGSSCQNFNPDAIFLDLGLPGYDRVEVIHFLSELECSAKIYLISDLDRMSLDSCQAAGVGFDLNVVGALTRPFTKEDIHFTLTV